MTITDASVDEIVKMLKSEVVTNRFVDIGRGVAEKHGFSKDSVEAAKNRLVLEGYEIFRVVYFNQRCKDVSLSILGPSGTTQRQAWEWVHNDGEPRV